MLYTFHIPKLIVKLTLVLDILLYFSAQQWYSGGQTYWNQVEAICNFLGKNITLWLKFMFSKFNGK